MPRTISNPEGIHPPPGYSHTVIATGSRLAFVAGQVALDPDFQLVGGDDLGAQTRAAMENLRIALDEEIGAAMAEAMGGAAPPAQVLLGVTSLAMPELLIEIEVVVSLP